VAWNWVWKKLEYFYNLNFYKFVQLARGLEVQTSVVRVNGLELTLRVSLNPIVKFIYTPCKCKTMYIYIYIYIYVYMIWHGHVKQYKCKKYDFDLRRGDFIMFLKISQLNGQLQKKKPSKYTPTTNSYDFARQSGL